MTHPALLGLAVAAALHAGFQLTVTALVYPALARVEVANWAGAHARHSRAITPLVVLVYGALVVTLGWALAREAVTSWLAVAAGGATLSLVSTAAVAAPTHGRLAAGRTEALVRRLLWADYVRTAGAVGCLAGAIGAAISTGGAGAS